jgi:putative component of membrane protein insertase Oxa1/YidC/SpoIIIJ protein YidD
MELMLATTVVAPCRHMPTPASNALTADRGLEVQGLSDPLVVPLTRCSECSPLGGHAIRQQRSAAGTS